MDEKQLELDAEQEKYISVLDLPCFVGYFNPTVGTIRSVNCDFTDTGVKEILKTISYIKRIVRIHSGEEYVIFSALPEFGPVSSVDLLGRIITRGPLVVFMKGENGKELGLLSRPTAEAFIKEVGCERIEGTLCYFLQHFEIIGTTLIYDPALSVSDASR